MMLIHLSFSFSCCSVYYFHSIKMSKNIYSLPRLQGLAFPDDILFYPHGYQSLLNSFSEHCCSFILKGNHIQSILKYLKRKKKKEKKVKSNTDFQFCSFHTQGLKPGIQRCLGNFTGFEQSNSVLKCNCNKAVTTFWQYMIYFVWKLILTLPSEEFS